MQVKSFKNRKEIKRILCENEYGFFPAAPSKVSAQLLSRDENFCAGKAELCTYLLTASVYGAEVKFPFVFCVPKTEGQKKTAVCLSFESAVPNKYLPAEEIVDLGWAFVSLCYQAVSADEALMDGNAKVLCEKGRTGKLCLWAWAAMRVMDWLQTQESVDKEKIAIVGHSRLGKTALLVGAFDERFSFVHSNDSGAAGAALYAEKKADSEDIFTLATIRPYWFCERFAEFIEKENNLPFDQDLLVGLIAPRVVCIGSAEEDFRANPDGEFACAKKASRAWEEYDRRGLIAPEKAVVGETYFQGNVGYYKRKGTHYFSREDWQRLLCFFNKKIEEK